MIKLDYSCVITAFQLGFVPGDSTVNQLIDIYNTFCKALDEGKEVRAIFCDISKAFDRVWHKGLLFKIKSAGVSGSLLSWFSDYLKDRKTKGCFAWCKFFLDFSKGWIHKALFLDLYFFFYISMTLLKTLTPLLDFLLTILACISLSMTPFRLRNN